MLHFQQPLLQSSVSHDPSEIILENFSNIPNVIFYQFNATLLNIINLFYSLFII